MATISITISTDEATRVTHALCLAAGLPETAANAKQSVINYIKTTVREVEQGEARQLLIQQSAAVTDVNPT